MSNKMLCQTFNIIPYPKSVVIKNDNFLLSSKTIIIPDKLNTFYSKLIIDNLKKECNINIKSSNSVKTNSIELIKAETQQSLEKTLLKENLKPPFNLGKEGYILNITNKSIKIFALNDAGIFYGIQTLIQLISANRNDNSIPCVTICDVPDIEIRGWQDDISRGPIPTLEYLKKEVVTMSSFKLNTFTLYTDNVYKFKKFPDISPPDGITEEDIVALRDFAKDYNVELIGNFQSFGHMKKILAKEPYKHLVEKYNIINPFLEESYSFLEDAYSEIATTYSSKYFSINCDEKWKVNEFKAKKMLDSIGPDGVYTYHINRVNKLLKPYNKQILIWSDVANYSKIVTLLPPDITIISWGYNDLDSFDVSIAPLKDLGINFWVAPGISCWNNIFPNLKVSNKNIYNYIRDGVKYGAKGVLNSTWDDDGLNFFENNWYSLAWGAELCWNAPIVENSSKSAITMNTRLSQFNKAFDGVFWGLKKFSLTSAYECFSNFHEYVIKDIEKNYKVFEEILPFLPDYIGNDYVYQNMVLVKRLDSLQNVLHIVNVELDKNKKSIDNLQFAITQVKFILYKNIFRALFYKHVNKKERKASTEFDLLSNLEELIYSARELKKYYGELWVIENRTWWYEENMKKYDNIINSLRDFKGNTLLFISDKVDKQGRLIRMEPAFGGLPIFYTLDGSEPTKNSLRYNGSFYVNNDIIINARIIEGAKKYPISTDTLIIHKAIGKLHKLNSTFSNDNSYFDGGGKLGLLDGRIADITKLKSGKWQGYNGQDINIELVFGKDDILSDFSMGFYQNINESAILPLWVAIYSSNDGINYKNIDTIFHKIPTGAKAPMRYDFKCKLNNTKAKYIKVVAKNYGKLPSWFSTVNAPSFLFSDEIIIK